MLPASWAYWQWIVTVAGSSNRYTPQYHFGSRVKRRRARGGVCGGVRLPGGCNGGRAGLIYGNGGDASPTVRPYTVIRYTPGLPGGNGGNGGLLFGDRLLRAVDCARGG